MNNIYLIGMPGCGKSTIGKILSEDNKYKFVDLDRLIEVKQRKTIKIIFEKFGENYFRNIETECLKEVSLEDGIIISTGGGIVLRQENSDIMKKNGRVIFIDTPLQNIIKNADLENRPLLADNIEKIYDLYKDRYDKYVNSADYVIENDDELDEVVEKIKRII